MVNLGMPNSKRSIDGIPLGIRVRRSIGKTWTFRGRRGNGSYNSIAGHRYQDKYAYVVPSSINNPESEPCRVHYAAAVDYWKNILTPDEKQAYNKRAGPVKGLSGYCLFIKEALTGKVSMFVDRGDPASVDFVYTDLTRDGAWHELDISAFIPAIARGVLIELDIESAHADNEVIFRK